MYMSSFFLNILTLLRLQNINSSDIIITNCFSIYHACIYKDFRKLQKYLNNSLFTDKQIKEFGNVGLIQRISYFEKVELYPFVVACDNDKKDETWHTNKKKSFYQQRAQCTCVICDSIYYSCIL